MHKDIGSGITIELENPDKAVLEDFVVEVIERAEVKYSEAWRQTLINAREEDLETFRRDMELVYKQNVKSYTIKMIDGEERYRSLYEFAGRVGVFLGETEVAVEDTKFKDYSPFDWAMYFIEHYGQIDGERHKLWVMDQVARIHKGTKPIIKIARWHDGNEEYRVNLGEPTEAYQKWVEEMEEDGCGYDEGRAP